MKNSLTGNVKWFSPERGFGFIKAGDGDIDNIFVSYLSIKAEGFKTLKKGQKVKFDLAEDKRGLFAKNVEIL